MPPAVPVSGRALPILWRVHRLGKFGTAGVQAGLLDDLAGVLLGCCASLIETGPGCCNPWFKAVLAIGWDFVGHLPGQVTIGQTTSTAR